ncbi:MAG TPA: hypothetical protein HPP76_05120 [Desulfuromonadales bacterium]|nr:hypothetical protein [Desulfuromonadales bacterium]
MAALHRVEISWEDLLAAFSSGEADRIYFLDRFTGEIFFVPSTFDTNDVRRQLDSNHERFLEIPPFDFRVERQIVLEFTATVENAELKFLLGNLLTGSRPYGKIEDIVSFFPKEEEQLTLLRDQFLSRRVKTWMEENNLYTLDSPLNSMLNL